MVNNLLMNYLLYLKMDLYDRLYFYSFHNCFVKFILRDILSNFYLHYKSNIQQDID